MNAARPLSVDLFCGYGGTSEGHRRALGVGPDVAINHDAGAIRNHAANFPRTRHLQSDIHAVAPARVTRGRAVDLLTASPDCGHYSRARGGKPCDSRIRDLGWTVVEWAREVLPRHIIVENVPEYLTWGPLHPADHPDPDLRNQPDPARVGETWEAWVRALRLCGYRVDWRILAACDYGAPTLRRRLFVQARCDGVDPAWPEPTHGPGRALPWRTAAECIDWSLLGDSIFDRRRPLAEATERRIAEGLRRYVFETPRPFLLCLSHGGRLEPIEEPLRTITAKPKGGDRAVVTPLLSPYIDKVYGSARAGHPVDAPLHTITSGGGRGGVHLAMVSPILIQSGYGEREGQRPRALDIEAPLGTVVAGGAKHALADAWLVRNYGGVVGHGPDRPLGAITTRDHHGLAVAHLEEPGKAAAAAFIVKYYGSGSQWSSLREPMHTIVTRARMGLVVVKLGGAEWVLSDITYRMLQPHELAAAQGFGPDYHWTGTKAERIAGIGHSVAPDVVAALIRANA